MIFSNENIIFGKIINKNEFIQNEVLILNDKLYINIIFIKNGNLVSVSSNQLICETIRSLDHLDRVFALLFPEEKNILI